MKQWDVGWEVSSQIANTPRLLAAAAICRSTCPATEVITSGEVPQEDLCRMLTLQQTEATAECWWPGAGTSKRRNQGL